MELNCQNISKTFRTRNGSIPALQEISFVTRGNEWICLVGPSGCGKTTLLKLIAGLIEPTSGTITFSEHASNGAQRSALVFQEHGLFPWMTTLDNVAFGLEMKGMGKKNRHEQARRFIENKNLICGFR